MEYKKAIKGFDIISTGAILLGLVFMHIYDVFNNSQLELNHKSLAYLLVIYGVFAIIKTCFAIKGKITKPLRITFSIIDLCAVLYLMLLNTPMLWPYFLLTIIVGVVTYSFGRRYGLAVLGVGALLTFGLPLLRGLTALKEEKFLELWVVFFVQIITWYISARAKEEEEFIESKVKEQKEDNEKLILEKEKIEKDLVGYKQLSENLEVANRKLEAANQRLNKSAAEFYTLQQISQAIATILDIKELLKFVNDVIIGVMGVNYSTILLSGSDNRMTIKTTNIYSDTSLKILKDNADCDVLKEVAMTGKPILANNVDEEKYPFVKERGVQAMLCIPLSSKNENYGLVLVEQERPDAFDDEHLKFLSAIGNQISVALENVGLYEKMQKMATTDALTKIYNRLYFNEALSKEMVKADKENYPMCVSIFDIDHFKKFNDTYGHLFGDLVLKTIARLAKDHAREQDLVARFGGEEFVIIMPNTTMEEAVKLIDDLRVKIGKFHVKEGQISASVTASFGIAYYPEHGTTEAEVLSAADTALYKAKTEGRNCVRTFSK